MASSPTKTVPRTILKNTKDGFKDRKEGNSKHLDFRNEVLTAISKRVAGRVDVLESEMMKSALTLRKGKIDRRRVHVINKADTGGFSRKAKRLGVRPHVCMFHEYASKHRHAAAVLYYDGTRGKYRNAYEELRPHVEREARPKVLMVTVIKRAPKFEPHTKLYQLMQWLSTYGYAPVGGWGRAAEAVSSGRRAYCFAMSRLSPDSLEGVFASPTFELRPGPRKKRPETTAALKRRQSASFERRLRELERYAEPRPWSSSLFPEAGKAERLRDAIEGERLSAKRLRRLRQAGPCWFWTNRDVWKNKPPKSRARIESQPEEAKELLRKKYFDVLFEGRFDDARCQWLLRRDFEEEAELAGRADVDLVFAILDHCADFDELLRRVDRAAQVVPSGCALAITLKADHHKTTLKWALDLESHFCRSGFGHVPCFDERMLEDDSEMATVVVKRD